jgi:hypothetical protein
MAHEEGTKQPADAGPVERPLGLGPERANPAVQQALERLRYVGKEIWDDITRALEAAKEDHCSPDMDELDCTLLLDLLWLYRHAEPLLTGKAVEVANAAAMRERCASLIEPKNEPGDWTGLAQHAAYLAKRIRSEA